MAAKVARARVLFSHMFCRRLRGRVKLSLACCHGDAEDVVYRKKAPLLARLPSGLTVEPRPLLVVVMLRSPKYVREYGFSFFDFWAVLVFQALPAELVLCGRDKSLYSVLRRPHGVLHRHAASGILVQVLIKGAHVWYWIGVTMSGTATAFFYISNQVSC